MYENKDADKPLLTMTVLPRMVMFQHRARIYSVQLADEALFNYLSKQLANDEDALNGRRNEGR